uniref:Uncharacterized protein n=1 Tax=Oryza brachyantha TaxID=4533 RepID=J3LZX9_ORYBR
MAWFMSHNFFHCFIRLFRPLPHIFSDLRRFPGTRENCGKFLGRRLGSTAFPPPQK